MRSFPLLILICVAACAQTAADKPAAAPAAEPSPDTVIASFDGATLTYGQFQKLVAVLPQAMQEAALHDRKGFVHQYFLTRRLAEQAEKEKLDQKSPTKEQLEYNRMVALAQVKINDVANRMQVEDDLVKKYYQDHQDKYSQVRLKILYVSFSSNPDSAGAGGAKLLSEDEAKAKIEKILADIRAGADFVKMVKQHSEDTSSAAKDGDFGVIRKSDNIPDAIRAVVFNLKPGQVSDPVRQPNGFYLFRAEEFTVRQFKDVEPEVYQETRQAQYQQWLQKLDHSIDVKLENEAFFNAAPPVQSPAPKP